MGVILMKQKFNKSLVLLLAVVMMMAMSVTAYATTSTPSTLATSSNATITVNFDVNYVLPDDPDTVITVPTETMTFNPVGFTTVFPVGVGATHQYLNQPTVMDAIYKISEDRFGYTPTIGWDTYNTPNGAYISDFLDQPTVTINQGSNYWKGYSWVLRINGQVQQLAADGYTVISADPDDMVKAMYYGSNHLLNNPVTGGYQQVNYIELSYELVEMSW